MLRSELAPADDGQLRSLVRERRPLKAATIALVLLACLASAVALTWSIVHSRTLELSNATISASNTALTLANQASSSFKMADTVLVSLVDKVEVEGWSDLNVDRLRVLMAKHMADLPALQGLFIYDETGRWIANSASTKYDGRNNADRAYFQYHKRNPGRGVHIGAPIVGRTSGVLVLPVSRRIEHPDGSFAGVALATIKVDFFRRIYEALDIGRDGRILMTLNDGTLLLQAPFELDAVGRSIAGQSVFRLQAQHGFSTRTVDTDIDGRAHIVSHARIGDYPVGIIYLRDKDTVLGPWVHSALLAYAALFLLTGGLLTLGRRVVRQIVLRDHLERELLATQSKLETANASLSTMAYVDGLTELFNRRYYEQALEREYRRAHRSQAPVAVLMIDVDHFKKYNDRYGHQCGDAALKAVARAIQHGLKRSGDLAARYGGEEFVVILPDTTLAGARDVAETIRANLARCAIAHEDAPGGFLTLSVGACSAIPERLDAGAAELVARADAALYGAKQAGRDRVAA